MGKTKLEDKNQHVSLEGHEEGHDHEHHQSFISKYIFSTDHKTIAKQYLITGILWAFIGGLLSVIFRLQLGFQIWIWNG